MITTKEKKLTRLQVEAALDDLPGTDIIDLAAELGVTPDEVYDALTEEVE